MLESNTSQTSMPEQAPPCHIAIIMDGNGRWAQKRGLPREEGHIAGSESLRRTVDAAALWGIQYLTMYAFSTENWLRPQEEVDALMNLLVRSINTEISTFMEQNIRLCAIGDIERLPQEARTVLTEAIEQCSVNTGLTLTLALSYSSRWELSTAMRLIAQDIADGHLQPAEIDDDIISQRLSTHLLPDPDLLIRTGGEKRISNFLLWQLAYAELYFTDVYWPDFTESDLRQAIEDFGRRQRRFGLTADQLTLR